MGCNIGQGVANPIANLPNYTGLLPFPDGEVALPCNATLFTSVPSEGR
jgi:hypothetical protein